MDQEAKKANLDYTVDLDQREIEAVMERLEFTVIRETREEEGIQEVQDILEHQDEILLRPRMGLAFLVFLVIKEIKESMGVTDSVVVMERKDFQVIQVDRDPLVIQVVKEDVVGQESKEIQDFQVQWAVMGIQDNRAVLVEKVKLVLEVNPGSRYQVPREDPDRMEEMPQMA